MRKKQNPTHECSWIVEKYGTTKPRDLEFVIPVPQLAGLLARRHQKSGTLPPSQIR